MKLEWTSIPMMGWTKHVAAANGVTYTIEKEDDASFVLWVDQEEHDDASCVEACMEKAQRLHDTPT